VEGNWLPIPAAVVPFRAPDLPNRTGAVVFVAVEHTAIVMIVSEKHEIVSEKHESNPSGKPL
jgi:hypothetical protein